MSRYSFTAMAVLALLLASSAQAAIVLDDNFDSYADQAAFQAAWPVVGTQPSGTLSSAQSVSAPNSINIPSSSTTAVSPRNGRSFTESGTMAIGDSIVFSFDFFDDAPTVSPYRNHANMQDGTAPGSANQLISMGLNNNQTATQSGGQFYMARILGYTVPTTADPDGGPAETVGGVSTYFKLNDFGVGGRTAGWHNLKAILTTDDGIATDYAFYVDNVLAEIVSNIGGAGTLRSYDHARLGSGVSSTQGAFYDNIRVEFIPAIPEPASLALFGVAALFLRRRRAA